MSPPLASIPHPPASAAVRGRGAAGMTNGDGGRSVVEADGQEMAFPRDDGGSVVALEIEGRAGFVRR